MSVQRPPGKSVHVRNNARLSSAVLLFAQLRARDFPVFSPRNIIPLLIPLLAAIGTPGTETA
jgi:hypothetical protein